VGIITIRGQLGSGAPEIAKLVAGTLGYQYVDREIITRVAFRIQFSEEGIARKEMPAANLSGRIVEAINSAYPPNISREPTHEPGWEFPLSDKDYLETLEEVLLALARNGSIVIRGRGSQFILKDFPDSLHILTVAPLDLRIRRISESSGKNNEMARKEISLFDSSRREFIKRYFKANLEDPVNYDLVLNTGRIYYEKAADLIVSVLSSKIKNPPIPSLIT
jgi:cytidylate kinase